MNQCIDQAQDKTYLSETHAQICERIYTDEVSSLTTETVPYQNSNFLLDPMVFFHHLYYHD